MVPSASVAIASRARGRRPSWRKPACSATPTSVPTVSKSPRKKSTNTAGRRRGASAAPRSRRANVGASDGGAARRPWYGTRPSATAAPPVASVPARIAPRYRRARSTPTSSVPPIATSTAGWCRSPSRTSVPGAARTTPAHSRPTSARRRPIPAAMACFSDAGIASISRSRSPTSERTRKRTPAMQFAPSATCHEQPSPPAATGPATTSAK